MARSCACDRLLSRAASDFGFRALPLLARMLWFELLAAAVAAPQKGHIRFLGSVSESVSRLVNRSETEIAADLDALARLGWLDADEDGRGVWMPGMRAAVARVEAARTNGLRGGRPRKGETADAARERRQGHLALPIAGGRVETQETKTEPSGESSRAAAASSLSEGKQAAAREAPSWVSLAQELAAIAGIDPARGGWNALPVKGWVDAGVPEDVILETVRQVAARPRAKPIGSLMFFHRAVMEAHSREAPREPSVVSGYEQALRQWQRDGAQGVPPSLAEWRAGRAAA
jgi:murein DD-endopeptidase MepM/ murein hydrolase activator NlpD